MEMRLIPNWICRDYPVYNLDINSLYPFVMEHYKYPVGTIKIVDNKFQEPNNSYTGFVLAYVEVNDCFFPILPFKKYRKDYSYAKIIEKGNQAIEKILFPVGKFYGIFSIQEFMYAIELRQISDYVVYKTYLYPSDYIFRDFIKTLYDVRLKSDNDLERYLWKKVMNSTYGKWTEHQKKFQYHLYPSNEYILSISEEDIKPYVPDCGLWREVTYKDKSSIINSIGAQITANARLTLERKIIELLSKGYSIYYMDTDSLTSNAPVVEFPISDKLGDWKIEYEIIEAIYLLPKTYWVKATHCHNYKSGECILNDKLCDDKFNTSCKKFKFAEIIKSKGIRLNDINEFIAYAKGKEITQKDVVKLSPFRKAIKSTGSFIGYKETKKSNKNPKPKRKETMPLEIIQNTMPQWCKDILNV